MDVALDTKNLAELSTLGHFLKGSSAAVGVIKVRDSCEHMQHYGKCHGEDGISKLSEDEALEKLTVTLRDVKVQYKEAAKALKAFYDEEDDGTQTETGSYLETDMEDYQDARQSIMLTTPTESLDDYHSILTVTDNDFSDSDGDDEESIKATRLARGAGGSAMSSTYSIPLPSSRPERLPSR